MLHATIKFFLENKLITLLLVTIIILGGVITSPFHWDTGFLPQSAVPVDAIPDIGENQQIVFTKWAGRSPQDIEDQISYPLSTSLLGISGVKTIRSNSMFGFSSIYIIFEDDVDFYWSRSRILEKLNSLPIGLLPDNVRPALGPDATALGQIFWYTLEGKNEEGNVTGGWDLHELRTIQDFQIRYALAAVKGVAEVASVGGYIKEYQVDADPNAMQAYGVDIMQVMDAVKNSNLDIGARTIEINQVEYFIRGIGYVKKLEDIEQSVVTVKENVPIRVKDVATVNYGPSERRGILDKEGAEVVGGVVVARYGANPLEVITHLKDKIEEITSGLPSKKLKDGTFSKINIVPFYDRTILINETLGTLQEALSLETIITIIVIIIMTMNMRVSILISSLIPIAVLLCFILMKYFKVDANIVALSGIAIAIGTIVDIAIVLAENIIRYVKEYKQISLLKNIYEATTEVMPAVITATLTTIVSFIPVFTLDAAEGKLFHPLAFTKTFVLFSALLLAIMVLPSLAHILFSFKIKSSTIRFGLNILLLFMGIFIMIHYDIYQGVLVVIVAFLSLYKKQIEKRLDIKRGHSFTKYAISFQKLYNAINIGLISLAAIYLLSKEWMPLGASISILINYIYVLSIISLLLGTFLLFIKHYKTILFYALNKKGVFLVPPTFIVIFGLVIWLGWGRLFGFIPQGFEKIGVDIRTTSIWNYFDSSFAGIGQEFMPSLDEGSFLLMPSSMPNSGIEENKRVLKQLDMAVASIPEVESVVGKLGRVNSSLDPAPISMYENIINYKTEYITDTKGNRLKFAVNDKGEFLRDEKGNLIKDRKGDYFRQWRDKIKSPDDIWKIIEKKTNLPGVTSAPKLQPIETRNIMLQTGMRAAIGIKILGDDLKIIEQFGLQLEETLKEVEGVKKSSVFADRIVGKPYIEIRLNRGKIAQYGLTVNDVQHHISISIGGTKLGNTVEGRNRFPIRVRYAREFRDSPEMLERVLIPTNIGISIPLNELADIGYTQGPQAIKSENTFLIGYVIFDNEDGYSEVEVVNNAQNHIKTKIDNQELTVPKGVSSYQFTGNYENQIRANKKLSFVVPIVFILIFLILYLQFRKISSTLIIFGGIAVAFAGGFIMIWLYGEDWFLNFSIAQTNIRELLQMKTIYLSVAVWVGFIALFGIATDDGVIITTYLERVFKKNKPKTVQEIRISVVEAGNKRIRPCLMTTATTILALLPVLTSSGRGSDIMIPMAIPIVGGMVFELITLFIIPIIYCYWKERKLKQ